jgi:putative SOS response-associated peptidase YedK
MCGRFTIRKRPDAVAIAAGVPVDGFDFTPRYNVAPSQPVLAFREGAAVRLRWGLIPSWAKEPAIGARMINARGETIAEKPSFRAAFQKRRCAIPADGFYEWRRDGAARQPYFIRLTGDRPFAFAGLWERWRDPAGAAIETCTIITTAANELVAPIHDRMPVILDDAAVPIWLAPGFDAPLLASLIAPCPGGAMEAYPVGTLVNRPTVDGPSLVAPLAAAPGRLL